MRFKQKIANYSATDLDTPEACVACDEGFVVELFEGKGLKIRHPIYYGSWRGGPGGKSYQDIILSVKE